MGMILGTMTSWVHRLIPTWVKQRIKLNRRARRLADIRSSEVPITLAQLERALRRLGVGVGDTLFIHSGADWLRTVEGGPKALLGLLRYVIGASGTLVMPSFPFEGLAIDYVSANVFDVRRSPSKMGLLTELFRRMPGVVRSLHPTHPVCAQGDHAELLTSEHHLDPRPFGAQSPFCRLDGLNAKILLIGVDSACLTHVHVVEDDSAHRFPIETYLPSLFDAEVIDREGTARCVRTRVHNPDISRSKSIGRFQEEWARVGVLEHVRVGHIDLRVFRSNELTKALAMAAVHGRTIYG